MVLDFISNTTTIDVFMASIPIIVLTIGIVVLKWNAAKAGSISLFLVIIIALFRFESTEANIVIAGSKGISLSIFVLSVIWSSVFMYNILEFLGFFEVIGNNITKLVKIAFSQNGMSLRYASDKLKNDREIVIKALKQNGLCL